MTRNTPNMENQLLFFMDGKNGKRMTELLKNMKNI